MKFWSLVRRWHKSCTAYLELSYCPCTPILILRICSRKTRHEKTWGGAGFEEWDWVQKLTTQGCNIKFGVKGLQHACWEPVQDLCHAQYYDEGVSSLSRHMHNKITWLGRAWPNIAHSNTSGSYAVKPAQYYDEGVASLARHMHNTIT